MRAPRLNYYTSAHSILQHHPPPVPLFTKVNVCRLQGTAVWSAVLYKNTMVGMETRSWGTLDPLRPYTLSLLSFPVGSSLSPSLHLGFLV